MTFWKVDYQTPEDSSTLTRWFRNSRDAEVFCDNIPRGLYDTNYYCREVNLPDSVLAAAERLWRSAPIFTTVPPVPTVAPVNGSTAYQFASSLRKEMLCER